MNRRLARLRAVQVLYQIDLTHTSWEQALNNTLEDDETADDYLLETVKGTLNHETAIDDTIREHLENWTLERVGNVDRAVLREGVHEMKYMDDIPLHVSVNEAVEIAKAFGGEESGKFVNGVLSSILKSYET
ncbi:transcription antitermination factor NusB [Salibacterium halotolerans]|uniref:Transcription antitermination protein NusB n=1 Tax=Salibacterium halotolerans TaxID=1884432 RepID=A0A1I5NNM3_9BACI|nr:transcription antitermination factor NusB [Salibacterium halotolerans]SFP23419.1 N utilization substance protein B [Salibacterium halotolerans]